MKIFAEFHGWGYSVKSEGYDSYFVDWCKSFNDRKYEITTKSWIIKDEDCLFKLLIEIQVRGWYGVLSDDLITDETLKFRRYLESNFLIPEFPISQSIYDEFMSKGDVPLLKHYNLPKKLREMIALGWKIKLDIFAKQSVNRAIKLLDNSIIFDIPLYPFQKYNARFLLNGGLESSATGLGKTLILIGVLDYHFKQGNLEKVLVVSLNSVIDNWQEKFEQFAPHLKVVTILGTKAKRSKLWKEEAQIQLITFGSARNDIKVQRKAQNWTGIVVDECQEINNWETKIAKAIKSIKVMFKWGMCVSEDSYVLTTDGIVQIGTLQQTKEKETYVSFDKTIETFDFDRFYEAKTSYLYQRKNTPVKCIETKHGYELKGTPHHRIVMLDKNGELNWKYMEQLEIGDHAVMRVGSNMFSKNDVLPPFQYEYSKQTTNLKEIMIPMNSSEELGYIMGLLVGDGTIADRKTTRLSASDDKIIERYYNAMKILYGVKPVLTQYIGNMGVNNDHRIHSRKVREHLISLGVSPKLSSEKEIPHTVLEGTEIFQTSFLKGLFDADGGVDERRIDYYSTSYKLIKQLQIMLLNMGIFTSKYTKPEQLASEEKYGSKKIYRLSFSDRESVQIFHKKIGFNHYKRKMKLKKMINHYKTVKRFDPKIRAIPNINKKLKNLWYSIPLDTRKLHNIILSKQPKKDKISIDGVPISSIMQTLYSTQTVSSHRLKVILNIIKKIYPLIVNNNEFLNLGILCNGMIFEPIKTIRDEMANVYDFHVPNTHSFTANGMINHNSATPMENKPNEIYSLMSWLRPNLFGSYELFRTRYLKEETIIKKDGSSFRKLLGYQNLSELSARLSSVMIRQLFSDVKIELPSLHEERNYVIPSALQVKLTERLRVMVNNDTIEKIAVNVPLKQIALDPLLIWESTGEIAQMIQEEFDQPKDEPSPKTMDIIATCNSLKEQGQKVLIYSVYVKYLKRLAQELEKNNIKYVEYHGGKVETKENNLGTVGQNLLLELGSKKDTSKKIFIEDPEVVVMLSSKASQVGTDGLQHVCSYLIHADLEWTRSKNNQRIGRLRRIGGQDKVISLVYLTEGTIDRHVERVVEKKGQLFDIIMDDSTEKLDDDILESWLGEF